MESGGGLGFGRIRGRRGPVAVGGLIAVVIVIGTGVAVAARSGGSAATYTPSATPVISASWAAPSAERTPTPTTESTPSPVVTPLLYEATTDGVLLTEGQAALATRHPIAVMIDDQIRARPQSGLSQADIVYQAPAEGGVPRYMAIFQTQDPASIGPIRSSRLYFVAWAMEWRAAYVHVGGATNALNFIYLNNGKYVWNAEYNQWGGKAGYMWRVDTRVSPHNVYSSGPKLQDLAKMLGATAPYTTTPWTFGADVQPDDRPIGGSISVPYPANHITYQYDRVTNTYPRGVSGEPAQIDVGNGRQVAPSNVIVLYQPIGALLGSNNVKKGRLEIDYVGHGKAMVFCNGAAIEAQWSKKSDVAPTLLTYAGGPEKGQPVPLVRGQIFIQIVPPDLAVTWKPGLVPSPR
jgi:hypothetical protein